MSCFFENEGEDQYIQLIQLILVNGTLEKGRNGNTKSYFGYSMRFSLKDGCLPLLTTKQVAWKTCFNELIWFIRGSTDNKLLNDKNVHIWDANSTREFLDSRGLTENEVNDLGPIYGHQWRHFNAEYKDCHTNYEGQGVDQLQNIINELKTEEGRTSRRLVMSAWNPCQIDKMALPPCHVLVQFNVRERKYLSCSLYQRSGDVGLGVPFNIASYSFLTHILALDISKNGLEYIISKYAQVFNKSNDYILSEDGLNINQEILKLFIDIVEFDNGFSYLRSKKLYYSIALEKMQL